MSEREERSNKRTISSLVAELAVANAKIKEMEREAAQAKKAKAKKKRAPPNPSLKVNPSEEEVQEAIEMKKSCPSLSFKDLEEETKISASRIKRQIATNAKGKSKRSIGRERYFTTEDLKIMIENIEVREEFGNSIPYLTPRSHSSKIFVVGYDAILYDDSFVRLMMEIHNNRIDREYGKGCGPANKYKPPSKGTIEAVRKLVADVAKINPQKGMRNERRFEALNDILNYASLAAVAGAADIDKYQNELIFNYDKSSASLNLTLFIPALTRQQSRKELKKHSRKPTVKGTAHNIRGISYGAVTSSAGELIAFIVFVKDNKYNNDDMKMYKLSGKSHIFFYSFSPSYTFNY